MNDRDSRGRFAAGNRIATGNPHLASVNKLRAELLRQVTAEDFGAIIASVITKGKSGDLDAAKIILRFTVGDVSRHVDRLVELKRETGPGDSFIQGVAELVGRYLDGAAFAAFQGELRRELDRLHTVKDT